jgi:phage shock protein PspC (stress-responsive transcriptional regulator)
VTLLRLVFIIATVLGGWGIVVYIAMWALMPLPPEGLDEPGEIFADRHQ